MNDHGFIAGCRQIQVVRAENQHLIQRLQMLQQPRAIAQIQQGGRLIEQKNLRARRQHTGESNQLLFAS